MSLLSRIFGRGDARKPQRLPSPDEAVLLAHPNGALEAEMLRELLAGQGIAAMVRNRDAATAQSGAIGPAWAYELWVRRGDLRRAREVLPADGAPGSE